MDAYLRAFFEQGLDFRLAFQAVEGLRAQDFFHLGPEVIDFFEMAFGVIFVAVPAWYV